METLKRPIWIGLCFFPFFLPGTALAWRGGGYGGWGAVVVRLDRKRGLGLARHGPWDCLLKMRYARGEISTEDFHRMGKDLR